MTVPAFGGGDENVLYKLLSDVLDAIVDTFDRAGVSLPDRRYVYFGGTAADCEQLTVQLDQIYKGTPGGDANELQKCGGPRAAAITAQLFRKTAALTSQKNPLPPVRALDQSAQVHMRDAWLMLDAAEAIDAVAWGTGVMADVTAQEASGEMIAVNLSLVVPVP